MRKLQFFLPVMPPSTNAIYSSQHWTKRRKEAAQVHDLVRSIVLERAFEPFSGPVHITTIPHLGKGVRTRDCSNFSYAHKMIEDALVHAGLIVDDTPEWVRGMTILAPIVDRQAPTGIEVIIQEVAS